jgi:hypothetical protein
MATICTITRKQFAESSSKATPAIATAINGMVTDMVPKAFSTGSFGWHTTGKVTATVDGKPVVLQVNVMATVVGSKDAK